MKLATTPSLTDERLKSCGNRILKGIGDTQGLSKSESSFLCLMIILLMEGEKVKFEKVVSRGYDARNESSGQQRKC